MAKLKPATDVGTLARAHTEVALQRIAGLSQNAESESVRLEASKSLLDHGWGRPKQRIEHGGKDGSAIVVQIVQAPYDEEDDEENNE